MSRTRRTARAAAWVAAGALGATALSGVALAATSTDPTPGPLAGRGMGYGGMMRGGMMGGGTVEGPGGPWLHGDGVVQNDDGTTSTVAVQTGQVVSAAAASVRVRSADGYEHAYAVTSSTQVLRDGATVSADEVRAGDTVRVRATVSGSTSTATLVHAMSAGYLAEHEKLRDERRARMQDRMGGRWGSAPAPTASS